LLGEFVSAVSLMVATIKFDGTLTLQAKGAGPISVIMAQCSTNNEVRAIVRLSDPDAQVPADITDFDQLMGANAVLAITIEPEDAERYQGIVPINKPSLAECLEHYFEQSEQIATRLWLDSDATHCAGLLLQALPKQLVTDEQANLEHWSTAVQLADTVKPEELLHLQAEQLVYRLFNEFEVRLVAGQDVTFACSCSRERSADALTSLGRDEVSTLLLEQGEITIDCQFCHQQYRFGTHDLTELFPANDQSIH
jgi:molecular chaperone Hsp33